MAPTCPYRDLSIRFRVAPEREAARREKRR